MWKALFQVLWMTVDQINHLHFSEGHGKKKKSNNGSTLKKAR